VCRVLDEAFPTDMDVVLSGGHALNFAVMLTRAARPHTVVNKYFGSMSKGIAAVIGVAIATRNPTMLIEGDVGFMMHLGEFDTAVRYKLPVLVVILNDQAMGSELQKALSTPELDPEMTRIPTPDLGAVGVALGGRGHLVRSISDLRSAVAEFVAQPGPMLVDVRISSNVQSIPTRRIHGDDEA
jgi:acetolactate synthase I/II/III large subunit